MQSETIINIIISVIVYLIIIIGILIYRQLKRKKDYGEAYTIYKKKGKKSVYWYDEYGNKIYDKPDKPTNPPRKRASK